VEGSKSCEEVCVMVLMLGRAREEAKVVVVKGGMCRGNDNGGVGWS